MDQQKEDLSGHDIARVNDAFKQYISGLVRAVGEVDGLDIDAITNKASKRVFEEWLYKGKNRGKSVMEFLSTTRKVKIQKLVGRYIERQRN